VDDEVLVAFISGDFSDPGFNRPEAGTAEDFTLTVDWGNGIVEEVAADVIQGSDGIATFGSFVTAHPYVEGGIYTVVVTVRDDDGGVDTATFTVGVARINVIPQINLKEDGVIPVEVSRQIRQKLGATQIRPTISMNRP
jgi:hypothetical protein